MRSALAAFTTIVLVSYVALAPSAVKAGFTAFSGDACNGDEGEDVGCAGECGIFTNRHSFRVDPGDGAHCVTLFEDAGCGGNKFFFSGEDGQCINVNTGTDIQSFRCATDNNCLN